MASDADPEYGQSNSRSFDLEFDLTHDDMASFNAFYGSLKPNWISCLLLAVVATGVGIGAVSLFYAFTIMVSGEWESRWNFMFPVVAIVTAIYCFSKVRRVLKARDFDGVLAASRPTWADRILTPKQNAGLGRTIFLASSVGVEETRLTGTFARQWDSVTTLQATESHVFILSDIEYIIPRRAFDTASKYTDFIESVYHWSGKGPISGG